MTNFRIKSIAISITLITSLIFPGDRTRIAVIEFKVGAGIDVALGESCTELLNKTLVSSKRFDVLERRRIREILRQKKFDEIVCNDNRGVCARQSGELLNVESLVFGTLDSLGAKQFVLTVSMVDVQSGTVTHSESALGKRENELEVQLAIEQVVDQLTRRTPIVGHLTEKVSNTGWMVNLGISDGLEKNATLTIRRYGKAIIDQSTGDKIGQEVIDIGKARVLSLENDYSIISMFEEKVNGLLKIADVAVLIMTNNSDGLFVPPISSEPMKLRQQKALEIQKLFSSGKYLECANRSFYEKTALETYFKKGKDLNDGERKDANSLLLFFINSLKKSAILASVNLITKSIKDHRSAEYKDSEPNAVITNRALQLRMRVVGELKKIPYGDLLDESVIKERYRDAYQIQLNKDKAIFIEHKKHILELISIKQHQDEERRVRRKDWLIEHVGKKSGYSEKHAYFIEDGILHVQYQKEKGKNGAVIFWGNPSFAMSQLPTNRVGFMGGGGVGFESYSFESRVSVENTIHGFLGMGLALLFGDTAYLSSSRPVKAIRTEGLILSVPGIMLGGVLGAGFGSISRDTTSTFVGFGIGILLGADFGVKASMSTNGGFFYPIWLNYASVWALAPLSFIGGGTTSISYNHVSGMQVSGVQIPSSDCIRLFSKNTGIGWAENGKFGLSFSFANIFVNEWTQSNLTNVSFRTVVYPCFNFFDLFHLQLGLGAQSGSGTNVAGIFSAGLSFVRKYYDLTYELNYLEKFNFAYDRVVQSVNFGFKPFINVFPDLLFLTFNISARNTLIAGVLGGNFWELNAGVDMGVRL